MQVMWIGILLVLILIICITLAFFTYKQSKKRQQNPVNIESLQKDINSSKEVLEIQVKNLKEQLESQKMQLSGIITDFKTTWNDSDRIQMEKVTTLINKIENFQGSLNKKEIDYKRNSDDIKGQIINLGKDLVSLKASSLVLGKINDNIRSLQEVFINTKKRGNIGEYLLEKILTNMLGSNSKLWERQYKTADNNIVDIYVKTTEEKEGIAIDSKFSFDNYKKYLEVEDNKIKDTYLKNFRTDIRNRINEVAKYISVENKISSAIMFIPSEEVFAFIYGSFSEEVVEYAFKKKVWITSPTSLAAILFTIEKHMKDSQFNKEVVNIVKKLEIFKVEFDRWIERWESVKKGFKSVNEAIDKIDITHTKMSNHYQKVLEMSEEIKESE